MDIRPIGVFDSGLGGLTAVKEIQKRLPHEDIIYLGDTARVPYGTRSKEVVTKFSLQDAYFLAGQGVKCIVIACNTASSFSYQDVKKKMAIPIFDVIGPGAADAVRKSRNNKIGVIGTQGTVASNSYKKAINKYAPKAKVINQVCSLFVPFIESGEIKGNLIELLIDKYLKGMRIGKVDTLVLGCTHYPILEKSLKRFMGKDVQIVNPAIELSKRILLFLEKKNLSTNKTKIGSVKYFLTDVTPETEKVAEMFLGKKLTSPIKKVNLD
ncbi:MAG: glutamate racemase, glutamate racemase [Candidatus Woesebacteria bacterium GW2011_GWC1_43_10b]|uniref:Glutamate racemase n=1 Tax=Candidatus Woesebacteria bacterium GW2011_GWC1_43_10b TaxID=1618585 RepID=A0A0G1C4G1_9BACT|nr:MAG: glutamate racemase, glutamate racemase [Candidatus Woesebacteria bacterium GW2011_GWC1_43_10b]